MAYTIVARKEGLSVEQQSFAVPLLTPILAGDWQGGDPMVALLRFRFKNDGPAPVRRTACPLLATGSSYRPGRQPGHSPYSPRSARWLTVQGNHILSSFQDKPYVALRAGYRHGHRTAGRHGAAHTSTPAR